MGSEFAIKRRWESKTTRGNAVAIRKNQAQHGWEEAYQSGPPGCSR